MLNDFWFRQSSLITNLSVHLICTFVFLLNPFIVSSAEQISLKSLTNDRTHHMGGKLTYSIKLAGVRAGIQTITIGQETEWKGKKVYPLTSFETSTGLVEKFYRFRADRLTYIDTNHLGPIFHRRSIEDRKYHATVEVYYDYRDQIVTHNKNGKITKTALIEGCQDELSWIYFLCHHPLKIGFSYNFPLLSKSNIRQATFKVTKETIKCRLLGKIRTLVITSESTRRKIWLSDDNRRIPVRIEAKVRVGRLVATLRKIEPLTQRNQ